MPSKHKRPASRTLQNGPVSHPGSSSQPQATQLHKTDSREHRPSPATTSETDLPTGDTTEDAGESASLPTVNRKKQKRREKEAAKRAAQYPDTYTNGYDDQYADSSTETPGDVNLLTNGAADSLDSRTRRTGRGPVKGYFTEETEYVDPHYQNDLPEDEEFYSNDDDNDYEHNYIPRTDRSWLNTSKRKKGLTRRSRPQHLSNSGTGARPAFPTLSNAALRSAHKMSGGNDHIWNTSTLAERENIKQFWLQLGEDERRKLLRVEKEAVLRKMKEQQKHSCSCSVCGRKRTAIEEELEVLYEAYYQELEQFAHHDGARGSPRSMPPPRHPVSYRDSHHPMAGAYPVQGRIHELDENGDEIEDEEDYEDDDEDAYSDEDYDEGPADFFEFGNSLTVKDGILTVADDLLKNDGKQFIDMMEQLAEKRLQREEEIHYPVPPVTHQSARKGYHQPPIDDEEEFDDEDDEDYDSQDEDDDYENDEMDSMTEDQRMEEGRRMFQIFAARMFEQRVLTAYKEKMAEEKQAQLLKELEEELEAGGEREAKKARDAAKRKDKKARQKAAQAEEKAKRDAEKAAEEAAAKQLEEAKVAEKKKKQEEQRKKKEAERKALEEEKLKKETDKAARLQKEREKQQEIERRNKESKEREKKLKEEQRKKEKEERDRKEAEAREKKRQEQEKLEQEAHERKAQAENAAKAEKEAKERTKLGQGPRRQPIVLPPGLQNFTGKPPALPSPHLSSVVPTGPSAAPTTTNIATVTTTRMRQASQPSQPSHSSSPQSQQASTEVSQTSMSPASFSTPQLPQVNYLVNQARQAAPPHHIPNSMSRSPAPTMGRAVNYPYNPANMHGMGLNGIGINGPSHATNVMPPIHNMYPGPPMGGHQRFSPNGVPPPGFNGVRPFPNQVPFYPGPPSSIPSLSQGAIGHHSIHARQASGSDTTSHPAPIGRPGPIARPSSVTPEKQAGSESDMNKITTMLGSSALLDGSDEPLDETTAARPPISSLGPPGTGRLAFASTSIDKSTPFSHGSPSWSSFGSAPSSGWSSGPRIGSGFGQPFDSIGTQQNVSRSIVPSSRSLRLLVINICREQKGFQPVQHVLGRLNQLKPINIPALTMTELHAVLDTIGDAQNGGGEFRLENDGQRGQVVAWIEPTLAANSGAGEIGSPVIGTSHQYGSIGQGIIGSHHSSGGGHGVGPSGRHF